MLLDHKYVVNTELYSELNDFSFNVISLFNNFQIREEITIVKNKIVFPENHYFHLVANLRKARFSIPLDFTLEYFISNINTWLGEKKFSGQLVYSCIYNNKQLDHVVYQEKFELPPSTFDTVELYREDFIASNLSTQINFPKGFNYALNIYREENELDDLFLLNHSNFLVGSFFGTVFLINGTELSTPLLKDGALDTTAREKFLSLAKSWPEFDAIYEKTINPFEITKADECFILTPFYNVISITKFRKTEFEIHYATEIKKKLIELVQ